MIETALKITLSLIPEGLIFLFPFGLVLIGAMGFAEALVLSSTFFIVFVYACNKQISFSFLDKDEDDKHNIIIAPEESASRYAKLFLERIFIFKPHTKHEYKYSAIGTSSLSSLEHVEFVYDVSHEVFWGLPKLSQMIKSLLIYYNLIQHILKNKERVHSIIIYSNPDLVEHFIPYIKQFAPNIKCLVVGLPDKDVVFQKVGKQSLAIINNSDKVILNMFGGLYTDYYKLLEDEGLWDNKKMTHCQSSQIMDYIDDAANSKSREGASDIALLLGSRIHEIKKHKKIAKLFLKTKYHDKLILLTPNEKIQEFLKELFPGVRTGLENDYDYSHAKVAICKSGIGIIKFILYGIPTIPYYIPNLRTFFCIVAYKVQAKLGNNNISKNDFILPYLVTKKEFLTSDFFGIFWKHKLIERAISTYNNQPNMEDFRILFAQNYLELNDENIVFRTFDELIKHYKKESRGELLRNIKHITDVFELSPEMEDKIKIIRKEIMSSTSIRSREILENKIWSLIEELRNEGKFDTLDKSELAHEIKSRISSTEVGHIYGVVAA